MDEDQTHPAAYMRLAVEIKDAATGQSTFRRQTTASAMRFYELTWMDSHTLQLDSAETGLLTWVLSPTNAWQDAPANADHVVPAMDASSAAPASAPVTRP